MINCKKCNVKCAPVYTLLSPNNKSFVCRECALLTMKGYYDRRPNEIEETD